MGIATGTTTGNTIPSTAAALLIPTRQPRISTVALFAVIPCPRGRRMHVNNKEQATGRRAARITEAGTQQTDPARMPLIDRATRARTLATAAEIRSATGRFRLTTPRGTPVPSEGRPARPARKPAVRGVPPAEVL